jgi:transposase
MRGADERSGELFSYVDLEARVRRDHPLRAIRAVANGALVSLERDFAGLYAPRMGRRSIAPEKLLRAMLLQALYSIRSERQLMERIEYDLLFRWFVGLGVDDPAWDHSSFSANRDRLLAGEIAAKFLGAVLAQPRVKRLLSSDHFSVDGTLIEAWASMKSFRPKSPSSGEDPRNGSGEPPLGGGRNAEANFRGEKRSNGTHESTSDPQARLYRKGDGQPAILCYMGHALMENRHGLVVGGLVTQATGTAARGGAGAPRAPPRRLGPGGHARDGQGLRRQGVRWGSADPIGDPACRQERPPDQDRQAPPERRRRAHDKASGLRPQPALPQAHRGGVRLDQNGGRPPQEPLPRR